MAPKARHAKGKARLNSYESLLNEDQKEKEAKLEIFIPNGPRLGNKVIEAQHIASAEPFTFAIIEPCAICQLRLNFPPPTLHIPTETQSRLKLVSWP